MDIKNAIYKAGTVSASALMALSVCAPALTASANRRRPVSHKRTVRKHTLTRNEKKVIRCDTKLIRGIDAQISHDERVLYRKNARALNRRLHRNGYDPEQRAAILGVIGQETGFTFQNNDSKKSFGYLGFTGPNIKGVKRYARKGHESPYSVITQMGYVEPSKGIAFRNTNGTPYQLYKKLERRYLHMAVPQKGRRVVSIVKRASHKAGLHLSKHYIREIKVKQEINVAQHYLGMPYRTSTRNHGAEIIARNGNAKKNVGTDNSGFIYGALRYAGFKTPRHVFTTMNMGEYFRTVPAKKAKHGDVIYNHKHSAILLQNYRGRHTHIIEEGGAKRKANISTVRKAFGTHAKLAFGHPER